MDNHLYDRQMERLKKREERILGRGNGNFARGAVGPAVEKLEAKIPPKLRATLRDAFRKSFRPVFEKGNRYAVLKYNQRYLRGKRPGGVH